MATAISRMMTMKPPDWRRWGIRKYVKGGPLATVTAIINWLGEANLKWPAWRVQAALGQGCRTRPRVAPHDPGTKKKQARRPVFRSSENAYFTPCISFWISGARASRITPPAISDQKPKV